MSNKTGGQAFPQGTKTVFPNQQQIDHGTQGGMTLRDYFAAKALQGQMSACIDMTWEQYAHDAYQMADAMLAERDK
jgi:hypothetical protein